MPATHFVGPRPWPRLTALSSRRGMAWVAVPYFGIGAAKMLPLAAGSVLVTRFDEAEIRSGQIHPLDIVELLERGVRVYQHKNLHAKVYVFGRRALIGSANVSKTSAGMEEACIETTEPAVVQKAKEFVAGLQGDELTVEYAASLQKLYRPPVRPVTRSGISHKAQDDQSTHTRIWTVPLTYSPKSETDTENEAAAAKLAKGKMSDTSLFRLEHFHWFGGEMRKVAVGDRVMQVVQKGRAMEFCPPARVVSIYRYRAGREYRWIFSLETRKKARVLLTTDMRSKLSKEEIAALKSNDVRLVSTEELRRKIGLVWALEE